MIGYISAAIIGAAVGARRGRSSRQLIDRIDTELNVIGDVRNFSQNPAFVPAMATVGAIAGVGLFWRFDFTWELFAFAVLTSALISQSIVDAATHRLSRRITISTIFLGAPLLFIAALVRENPGRLGVSFFYSGLLFFTFLLLWAVSRGGIGGGDVRLAIVMGMYLGWLGAAYVLVGVLAASVLGGLAAVLLLVSRRATRSTRLAFGPYLAIGTLVSMMVGDWIARVWLGM
ncbi:MAG: A24 family peptidase [Ilumatobacteraceae bacterium]